MDELQLWRQVKSSTRQEGVPTHGSQQFMRGWLHTMEANISQTQKSQKSNCRSTGTTHKTTLIVWTHLTKQMLKHMLLPVTESICLECNYLTEEYNGHAVWEVVELGLDQEVGHQDTTGWKHTNIPSLSMLSSVLSKPSLFHAYSFNYCTYKWLQHHIDTLSTLL